MTAKTPSVEPRRRKELRDEIVRRARLWLPEWRPSDDRPDVAKAIFEIAARLESEVTQRLDRTPEKAFRGFLHWLGIGGGAGHPAQLPIVLKLADKSEAVLAAAPVQVQADVDGQSVIFETEEALLVTPAKVAAVIGAEPGADAFYEGPVSGHQPPEAAPTEWRVTSDVGPGDTQLQLDPPVGLKAEMVLRDAGGRTYRIVTAQDGLVTIEPGLGTPRPEAGKAAEPVADLGDNPVLTLATAFEPFKTARDQQEHALYIGSKTGLDLKFPAVIQLSGAAGLESFEWTYWGKATPTATPGWNVLERTVKSDRLELSTKSGEAGAIEPTKVNEVESRWLRAKRSDKAFAPLHLTELQLTLNCGKKKTQDPEPASSAPATVAAPSSATPSATSPTPETLPALGENIELDGVANTAPLVVGQPFYPLGREPRIFEAFYLGCQEAFSKPKAFVTLDFKVGEGFAGPLAAIEVPQMAALAAGIGMDGKLHIVKQAVGGVPVPPLAPEFLTATQPIDDRGRPVSLTSTPPRPDGKIGPRPGGVVVESAGYFAAAAGPDVWVLFRPTEPQDVAWKKLEPAPSAENDVTDVVLSRAPDGTGFFAYAISGGRLYRGIGPGPVSWTTIGLPDGVKAIRIAPVLRPNADAGDISSDDGVVVVGEAGELCFGAGAELRRVGTLAVDSDAYPLALTIGGNVTVFARASETELLGVRFERDSPPDDDEAWVVDETQTTALTAIGGALGVSEKRGDDAVVVAVEDSGGRRLAIWEAFGSGDELHESPSPDLVGAPVPLGENVSVLPLENGAVSYGVIDKVQDVEDDVPLRFAAIALGSGWGGLPLLVEIERPGDNELHRATDIVPLGADGTAILLDDSPDEAPPDKARVHRGGTGAIVEDGGVRLLELEAGASADDGDRFYLAWTGGDLLATVTDIPDPNADPLVVQLSDVPPATVTSVTYWRLDDNTPEVRLRPALHFANGLPDILKGSLDQMRLDLGGGSLRRLSHALTAGLAVLADRWLGDPPATVDVDVVIPFAARTTLEPGRRRNPELSWEYWDGSSWRLIEGLDDQTAHFVKSGLVTFCVPEGLQPTDVIGRQNHWIRARLVGGDYGEAVVRLEKDPKNADSQIAVRDTSGIRPPFVVSLEVLYEVCCPIAPDVVLTHDNGGWRDQTNANRSSEARVDVFAGLSYSLAAPGARASAAASAVAAREAEAKRDPLADAAPAPAKSDRTIYIGFDAPLEGAGISLLFLLDDVDHGAGVTPMEVEGFVGGAFAPVQVEDGTRGLSETGVVTLSLSRPLQQAELFGRTLFWLRFAPSPTFTGKWSPILRGVWANGVWATAAETQRNELLGSSDGSPGQRFILARRPVIADSLRLRVREPLGDEDVEALNKADANMVVEPLGPWPGRWVLWRAGDPAGAGPRDRVYAFDAASSEITFGNGEHGLIPPLGRDNIVAQVYRAGGGAAANGVQAWGQLNLISAVRGVEATIAPEGAAGGADPQDAAAVLNTAPSGIAMHDRAVTLRDFERLAVRSSALVAQARAFAGREGVRVVAAMRRGDPRPSSAQRREIRRFLLARAGASYATPKALTVDAPERVAANVRLKLTVADLSLGPAVEAEARKRLAALLDPGTGGLDGRGWPLGATLSETDVAAQLVDLPDLEDFEVEVAPAPGAAFPLKPDQLLHAPAGAVIAEVRAAEPEEVA